MVVPVSSDSGHSHKQTHQHQHQHHHHHDFNVDWSVRGGQLELEGETIAPITTAAIEWARSRSDLSRRQVERIVDVGCGPGVASCMLAAAFDHAEVIALDASADLLAAASRRADLRGVGERVHTVQSDMASPLEIGERVDLVWASMVVHHLGDEVATLARLGDVVRSGGLIVVTEFGLPTTMLPDDVGIGPPGLEARCRIAQAGWFDAMRAAVPDAVHDDDTWVSKLGRAGFVDVEERLLEVRHRAPLSPMHHQFVRNQLERTLRLSADKLDAVDLATFDVLLATDQDLGIDRRDDVFIDASRTVIIGRWP